MSVIIPAIIPRTFEHLSETLQKVMLCTREVQIDIVDGVFVPFTSWPYTEHASLLQLIPLCDDFDIEIDLMTQTPELVVEAYLAVGVKRIVIHLESTQNLEAIIALKQKYNFKLGFSILNDTAIDILTSVIVHADYVQLMGISKIGSQAQPFDARVLERVTLLKAMYPNLQVSVDGSVNAETLLLLKEVGVTRFVVGSALFGAENVHDAYHALHTLL